MRAVTLGKKVLAWRGQHTWTLFSCSGATTLNSMRLQWNPQDGRAALFKKGEALQPEAGRRIPERALVRRSSGRAVITVIQSRQAGGHQHGQTQSQCWLWEFLVRVGRLCISFASPTQDQVLCLLEGVKELRRWPPIPRTTTQQRPGPDPFGVIWRFDLITGLP